MSIEIPDNEALRFGYGFNDRTREYVYGLIIGQSDLVMEASEDEDTYAFESRAAERLRALLA